MLREKHFDLMLKIEPDLLKSEETHSSVTPKKGWSQGHEQFFSQALLLQVFSIIQTMPVFQLMADLQRVFYQDAGKSIRDLY